MLGNIMVWSFGFFAIPLAVIFIPVVLVEVAWIMSRLKGLRLYAAILPITVANLLSSIVGLPICEAIFMALEFVAPFFEAFIGSQHLFLVAMLICLIPFFIASAIIESWFYIQLQKSGRLKGEWTRDRIKSATWSANGLSYLMLLCIGLLLTVTASLR